MIETRKKLRAQRFAHFLCALAISLSLAACSRNAPPPPDAATLLQKVPASDSGKYPHLRQGKKCSNPYLVFHPHGIGLAPSLAHHQERLLNADSRAVWYAQC